MKFKDLRDMYIQHFVYEFVNDSLPKSLSHIFEYNRDIHRHNTRHSTGCLKKMIHFSIGNIFVNPGDTAKPNISLYT